jgi:hypothetical protein
MDFAKSNLQSFGWREGMGLKKSENGIKIAVKPKLKFDNYGFGFDINQSMTNDWTTQAFNLAAIGLKFKLTQTQSGVKLKNNSKLISNQMIRKPKISQILLKVPKLMIIAINLLTKKYMKQKRVKI